MPAAFKVEVRTVSIFFRLCCNVFASFVVTVSYTNLTLPTKRIV